MIEFSGKRFLPRLYIRPIDALSKSIFNGKIKVSVRKITAAFGSASGTAMIALNMLIGIGGLPG